MRRDELASLFDLTGRVAVVTGGGRGIGRGISEALAAHGATVVLTGRNGDTLARACEQIVASGGRASWLAGDVSREPDVEAMAAQTLERHGRVDILVNNAGVNPYYKRPEATTLAQWQEVIDVNLTGVFLCCRIFGTHMLTAGSGSIINVTSVAGHVGLERSTAYCGSKGGVEILSKSLALDWAAKGVRVNCIAPGYVETDLTAGVRDNPHLKERLLGKTPLGRFAESHEIGGAAVFLASRAAGYMTGQTLVIDGGWTAQ